MPPRRAAKRCVIYLRQSLDAHGTGAGIARQREDCVALAERRGYEVITEIAENDQSATRGVRRGYRELLRILEEGAADVVVAWHPDRLYRRPLDLEELITLVETRSIAVETAQAGDFDLTTDAGRLYARIMVAVAKGEVERKGARQRRANLQRAAEGQASWTLRPFGYIREGREVQVVPEEAAAIRWAVGELCDGKTLADVARRMGGLGVRTTREGEWTASTLRRLLLNPRLAGVQTYQGKEMGTGTWDGILTTQEQERVTQILRAPGRRVTVSNNVRWLLSGIAVCGRCDGPMRPAGNSAVYNCRDGGGHLTRRAEPCDDYVSAVAPVLLARNSHPLTGPRASAAQAAEVMELKDRRDALASMLATGLLSQSAAMASAERLTQQIKELEEALLPAGLQRRSFLGRAAGGQEAWDARDIAGKRRLLRDNFRIRILPLGKGVKAGPETYMDITYVPQ